MRKRKEILPLTVTHGADDQIEVTGGRGLEAVMLRGTAKHANALGYAEIIAVLWAVRNCPFPLGGGERIYRAMLDKVLSDASVLEKARQYSLATLREQIAIKSARGGACNAPHDSYLRIAYDIATGAEYISRY